MYIHNQEKNKDYTSKTNSFIESDIDELKNAISKCTIETDIQYAGSFSPALPILSSIKIEEIGTLN